MRNIHFIILKITRNYGKYEYSNANYNLLGKIIESVSNDSYSDYITKNILKPLDMNHTGTTLEESNKNGLIKGYQNYFGIPIAESPNYPTDDKSWIQVPAGFISSSASDMGKYLQMYLNQGELKDLYISKMIQGLHRNSSSSAPRGLFQGNPLPRFSPKPLCSLLKYLIIYNNGFHYDISYMYIMYFGKSICYSH